VKKGMYERRAKVRKGGEATLWVGMLSFLLESQERA